MAQKQPRERAYIVQGATLLIRMLRGGWWWRHETGDAHSHWTGPYTTHNMAYEAGAAWIVTGFAFPKPTEG